MGAGGAQDEADRLRAEVEHLHAALTSRDVIGQAKGILMERYGIGAEEAFDRLVRISQATNTKLRDVAATVAGEGAAADGDSHGASGASDGAEARGTRTVCLD